MTGDFQFSVVGRDLGRKCPWDCGRLEKGELGGRKELAFF